METADCPIWKEASAKILSRDGGSTLFESTRAGGKFRITPTAQATALNIEMRLRLTDWIVDHNEIGSIPLIKSDVLDKVKAWPDLGVQERADRLLSFYAEKTKVLGTQIRHADLPQAKQELSEDDFNLMLAKSSSRQFKEINYLVEHLEEQKLIEISTRPLDQKYIRVKPKGFSHIDELKARSTKSEQAFVAMWFHDSMKKAADKGFSKAISDAGYLPIIIDRQEHINKIDDEIIAQIRRSRFIVADFTSEPKKPRGGVYFEAGFAYGLRIPVIWTCHEDLKEELHFDTHQFNHIIWSDVDDLYRQLKARIEAVIGDGPLKNTASTQ